MIALKYKKYWGFYLKTENYHIERSKSCGAYVCVSELGQQFNGAYNEPGRYKWRTDWWSGQTENHVRPLEHTVI